MKMRVFPSVPTGSIKAIASKSAAHRLLICAAFANAPTRICCEETNKDIEATVACLCALGARICRNAPFYDVEPVSIRSIHKNSLLPCGESGSTLRFLLPVVAALGAEASFLMEGRLPDRPLSPLWEELEAHGIELTKSDNLLIVGGKLTGTEFSIVGNVSSQFVSGLLFALSLRSVPSSLTVTEPIESAPYIDITADALSLFGNAPHREKNTYFISGKPCFISPDEIIVEGDWSNSAFMLALGIMGKGNVYVKGLNHNSSQGDSEIIRLLRAFGGNIEEQADGYIATHSTLHGISIDASQIPDLVPILATVASVASGQTEIFGASRLRLKESDRLDSVCQMLSALGADIKQTDDGLIINGKPCLDGGVVSSANDHRIAMSAAVAACVCRAHIVIDGAEAVKKSYPMFWEHIGSLGMKIMECDNN